MTNGQEKYSTVGSTKTFLAVVGGIAIGITVMWSGWVSSSTLQNAKDIVCIQTQYTYIKESLDEQKLLMKEIRQDQIAREIRIGKLNK